jgi:hypothetical protein
MAPDARALEHEIEVTRARLDTDVDALAEKVSPRNVARRTAQSARERVMSTVGTARDSVMGTASDVSDRAAGLASDASGAASDLAGGIASTAGGIASTAAGTMSRAADTAGEAASTVRRQTGGSPLVAGLVAFGVGWIASGLIPASKTEERLAARAGGALAEHSGALQAMTDHVKSAAAEVGTQVSAVAQEAAHSVQDTARGAAEHVVSDARDAKDTMTGQ